MQKTTDDQNELFIVVDKDDNFLEYRTRFECHHDKRLLHRVVNVAVFDKEGRILLQKRSKNKDLLPGFYTLSATGHVNQDEDYQEAAERELEEELGIKVKPSFLGKFSYQSDKESEMVAVFKVNYTGKFKINKKELDSIKFFKTEEVKKMIMKLTPGAIGSLKKLNIL